ncbi:MAG: HAD family hydrolase [Myxococcota bacterium]
MAIAFFDFDKTLVEANTAAMWVRREVVQGHVSRLHALRASVWMAKYHLGFVQFEDALVDALSTLRGSSSQALAERTKDFYEREVRHLYRPRALEALSTHRSAGDLLVLLTTSPHYLASLVAEELELDGYLSTRLEVGDDGLHTGRPVGRVCFGRGKLTHASAYAGERGVRLYSCSFYTDSYSDLPVMEQVGNPVAVNPDLRLRRHAARRGWRIVDWSAR